MDSVPISDDDDNEKFCDEDSLQLKQYIFRYLHRNYTLETADRFANESELGLDEEDREFEGNEKEDDGRGEELLERYLCSKSQMIIGEYTTVHKWVTSSLPLYQPELEQILYPLFVFTYIDILMSRHFHKFGNRFFSKYEEYHSKRFPQKVLDLKCVTSPDIMEHSQYVRMLIHKNRPFTYYIKLSSGSFELFVHFINDQKLTNIKKIADERIKFETFKGKPRSSRNMTSVLFQDRLTNISKMNSIKIDWDILPNIQPQTFSSPVEEISEFSALTSKLRKTVKQKRDNPNPNICLYTIYCGKKPPNTAIIRVMNQDDNPNSMKDEEGNEKITFIAVACPDSPICCWNWDDKLARNRSRSTASSQNDKRIFLMGKRRSKAVSLRGHQNSVLSMDMSYDYRWLISGSLDKTINLWTVESKNVIVRYRQPHPSWQVKFSGLGYIFGSVGLDRAVTIWATDRPDPLRLLVGHTSDTLCLCFHNKVDFIASGSADQTVRCWDSRSPRQIRLFSGPKESVQCVTFSRDGQYLACGTGDEIWVWDLRTTKLVNKFCLHLDEIIKLEYSARDDILISSSLDGTVKMWDVKNNSILGNNSSSSRKKVKKKALLNTFYTNNSPVYDFQYVSRNTIIALGIKRNDIQMFQNNQ